jgi:hypothetical protein
MAKLSIGVQGLMNSTEEKLIQSHRHDIGSLPKIRNHPFIQAELAAWWASVWTCDDICPREDIEFDEYRLLYIRALNAVTKVGVKIRVLNAIKMDKFKQIEQTDGLIPPHLAEQALLLDWHADSQEKGYISKGMFYESVLRIAEQWCSDVDQERWA